MKTFEDFEKEYTLVDNHFEEGEVTFSKDDDSEFLYIHELANLKPNNIWTASIDPDNESLVVLEQGYLGRVNVLFYVVTVEEFKGGDSIYQVTDNY